MENSEKKNGRKKHRGKRLSGHMRQIRRAEASRRAAREAIRGPQGELVPPANATEEQLQQMRQRVTEALRRRGGQPIGPQQLANLLQLRRVERALYLYTLEALRQEGALLEQGTQMLLCDAVALTGRIVKVSEHFAFASLEDGQEDIFIPGRFLKGALPGDEVLLLPKQRRGERSEAQVLRILRQNEYQFTGVVRLEEGRAVLAPDSERQLLYPVVEGGLAGAQPGDKVLAAIVDRGEQPCDHRARVLQVFGSADRAEVCARAVLVSQGVPLTFSEPLLAEAQAVSAGGIPPGEIARRLDLREKCIFTIDGADTKDIDDAISLEQLPDGWALGVHIADVSHYVRPGSLLDAEAYQRGTSVYYADQVVPMLPKALSNGICSLNPQEDRLAFSALMELDGQGELRRYRFCKTVIRSRVKGVYSEINALYSGTAPAEVQEKYAPVWEALTLMRQLAGLRHARRRARGAIELQSVESKILVGESGRVEGIYPRVQGESEQMIEEFMLAANEAAASFGLAQELPFLFRIHEKPSAAKLETLHTVLSTLGLECRAVREGVTQAELSNILEGVRDTPLWRVVNGQILRAMAKARYSDQNLGHYGLVTERYAHFTSPIRRYPDLAIHRVMSAKLAGMPQERIEKEFRVFAGEAADQSSRCEQRAVQAERDCEDCYKAEYMLGYLGERFEGIISGVAPHGLYVELPNTVEGLLRMADLPEGEYQNDGCVSITERLSGKRYRVGDPIAVIVARANVTAGQVDFSLAEEQPSLLTDAE